VRLRVFVTTAILWAAVAVPVVAIGSVRADSAPASFTFGAAGDLGANAYASSTLNALAGAGTDFFFALGDLSYSEVTPESAWCDFVKSRVGSSYPFELVAGNHEANASADGTIANFAACLPDRLGQVVGSYAKEAYVDYPQSQPLARFITISPNLSFPGESVYAYTVGSARYKWLSNAIDGARASGIRWVIVGMHEVCMSAGGMPCQISADLQNLLVGKKVDLVLQGHEHGYERSKQLALGPSCTAVPVGSFKAGCVAGDGANNTYAKGAGTVIVISGTGGEGMAGMNTGDPEAPYFAKLMGSNMNPTVGFMKYTVSAAELSAKFVRSARGNFTDSFTISGAPANNPPAAVSTSATTSAGSPVTVTLRGSDVETCELTFSVVTGPAHGTLSPLTGQSCGVGSPNQDTATATYTRDAGFTGTDSFTYRVNDGTADSNTATVSLTVNPAGNSLPAAADVSAATNAASPVTVTLRGSDVETCELTFSVVTGPPHGSLSPLTDQPCRAGSPNQDTATATFTPAAGFTGTDSFTYRVNDGTADSNAATATVTVSPAGGGISFRGATSAQNTATSSLTIGRPASATTGDVLLAAVAVRGTTTITPPAGWTFVRLDNAANYTIQAVYYRVVSSAEPPSYQWTFSSSNAAAGGILDYRGVSAASPIDAHGGAATGTATTSILAPSITTTVPGTQVVGLFGIGGSNSITPPPGMTEESKAVETAGSLHVTWEGSDFTQASAGATGTRTARAAAAHPNVGQLVALKPA
jgi:hypothetical protein